MKIKIAYSAGEVDKALKLARACLAFFPKGTQTKHSDRHKPFLHIYIADTNNGHDGHNGSSSDRNGHNGHKNATNNTRREKK